MMISDALRDTLRERGLQYLRAELQAAGQPADLLLDGNWIGIVTSSGAVEPSAAAQAIIANHVPPALVDYGADDGNVVDIEQLRNYVQASRAFLANGTPSNADVVAQVKRNTRAILAIIRLVSPHNG